MTRGERRLLIRQRLRPARRREHRARPTPGTLDGLSGVVRIAAGRWHACVVTRVGAHPVLGGNRQGGVSDGTTTDHAPPAAIPRIDDAVEITCCTLLSCVALQNVEMDVPDNVLGQLGDGMTDDRPVRLR